MYFFSSESALLEFKNALVNSANVEFRGYCFVDMDAVVHVDLVKLSLPIEAAQSVCSKSFWEGRGLQFRTAQNIEIIVIPDLAARKATLSAQVSRAAANYLF